MSPGWADELGKQLAGDDDVWQRTRARGGKPFRIGNSASYAQRGASAGGKSKHATARLLEALGKAEDEE